MRLLPLFLAIPVLAQTTAPASRTLTCEAGKIKVTIEDIGGKKFAKAFRDSLNHVYLRDCVRDSEGNISEAPFDLATFN